MIDDAKRDKRLAELEASEAEACAYLERLFVHILREHFPENNITQPLSGDLLGLITQIDNALTAWRELEARIAAKDETLKEIWADAGYYANNPQCGDLEDVLERINDIAREALKK